MTIRRTARVTQRPEKQTYSAAIIRFPLALSARRLRRGDVGRPSLALNILLVLLLVLACVVWEAIAARNDGARELRQSQVTSPRMAAVVGPAALA